MKQTQVEDGRNKKAKNTEKNFPDDQEDDTSAETVDSRKEKGDFFMTSQYY